MVAISRRSQLWQAGLSTRIRRRRTPPPAQADTPAAAWPILCPCSHLPLARASSWAWWLVTASAAIRILIAPTKRAPVIIRGERRPRPTTHRAATHDRTAPVGTTRHTLAVAATSLHSPSSLRGASSIAVPFELELRPPPPSRSLGLLLPPSVLPSLPSPPIPSHPLPPRCLSPAVRLRRTIARPT